MQKILKNIEPMTNFTDLRGSRVRRIHRGSVLLSKQEDLCSTSYVRVGRSCSTSYSSGNQVDGSPLVAIRKEWLSQPD